MKVQSLSAVVFSIVGLVVPVVAVAAPITYDANAAFLDNEKPDVSEVNPFTDTNSPAGVWSYGQSTEAANVFSTITNHTDNFIGNTNIEGYYVLGIIPCVLQNTSNALINTNFGADVEPSEILLHPDADNGGTLRFTVPLAGTYTIAGNFEKKDPAGNGTINQILLNQSTTPLFTVTLTSADTDLELPGAFNFTQFLNAGDNVDFVVFDNGNFGSDSTGFFATLTVIPEPASLSLLGLAIPMLARRRR